MSRNNRNFNLNYMWTNRMTKARSEEEKRRYSCGNVPSFQPSQPERGKK